MAIPHRVPIAHEPGYRTDTIGRYDGGQFFGSVTATIGDMPDWQRHKRWHAVLHRFDADGAHTGSEIWFAGTSENETASIMKAEERLTGGPGAARRSDARCSARSASARPPARVLGVSPPRHIRRRARPAGRPRPRTGAADSAGGGTGHRLTDHHHLHVGALQGADRRAHRGEPGHQGGRRRDQDAGDGQRDEPGKRSESGRSPRDAIGDKMRHQRELLRIV
jgi:hypothetical protein